MAQPRHHRRLAPLLIGTALLLGLLAGPAAAQFGDPVEDLRAIIPLTGADITAKSPQVLKFREDQLRQRINALRGIGQLRRALALDEWKETTDATNLKLRDVDFEMRKLIADRFRSAVKAIVARGTPNQKLAVANLIAEIGPTIRSDAGDNKGFAFSLAPQVKQLAQDENLAVREQGLRALGNINADPKDAVPVFTATLKNDQVGPRRVAAEGLLQMVRVVAYLQNRLRTAPGEQITRDLLDVTLAVNQATNVALGDEDEQVRKLLLEAIHESAKALGDSNLIPEGMPRTSFPPEGRELTEAEKKEIVASQKLVMDDLSAVEPVLFVYQAQGPALAQALQSQSPAIRLAAIRAVEEIGSLRLRIRRRVLSVPNVGRVENDPRFKALALSDPLAVFSQRDLAPVIALLKDSDTRVRLAAVDVLELLEDAAQPALPALAESLGDPDRFVRWAAARAIGNIGPEHAAEAVPGLAKLACDPDNNVRLAALTTLQLMGPLARPALPALAQAVTQGDSEVRVATMATLLTIGGDDAKIAVPGLIQSLTASDPRVRRAAAESLGRLGPLAEAALPALRRALGDEDQETRIFASEAILNIIPLPTPPL